MLRVVIDTNVLLSGLLWHGAPHVLLERVRAGTLGLVSSPAILGELENVIARPKFDVILARSNTSREIALAELRQLAEVIEPPRLESPVCRDPDDDAVLALALAAQVDMRCEKKHTAFGVINEDSGSLHRSFGSSARTSDLIIDSLYAW